MKNYIILINFTKFSIIYVLHVLLNEFVFPLYCIYLVRVSFRNNIFVKNTYLLTTTHLNPYDKQYYKDLIYYKKVC